MSSGGRVFPSATGGGLERGSRAILEAVITKKDREERERRAAEGLGVQNQQLDIASRQVDIAERAADLNRITALSSYLEPGTTLGDLGQRGMEIFGNAFGVDAAGLEDLELRPETLDSALDRLSIDLIQSPDFADQLTPALRARLGLNPSEAVANVAELEAALRASALTEITDDPGLVQEFTSRVLGREPITLTIPGVDGSPDSKVSFDSAVAANIYAQFRIAREGHSFRLQEIDAETEADGNPLIEEIKTAVAEANEEVSSTAIAGRIIPMYNAAVENQDLTEIQAFLASDATSGEKLALQFLMGSITAGEDAFMSQLPPQLRNFLLLGQALESAVGRDEAAKLLPQLSEQLDPANFSRIVNPFGPAMFGRGPRIDIGGAPTTQAAPPPAGPDLVSSVVDEDIVATFRSGDMTREELIAVAGQAAVDRALGPATVAPSTGAGFSPTDGINPTGVPAPFRADAQRLNTLINRRDSLPEGPARTSIQNVIDRLRTRITTGIGGIGG